MTTDGGFTVPETTIADIHAAYRAGTLTARALVEAYLDRIETYDRNGPAINSIVSVNPNAKEEAARLDAEFARGGPVGPLHGIPVIMKDQADVDGMPTTMGSVLFKDHFPGRDCFVAARLKAAGAIVLAKSTLGEMGRAIRTARCSARPATSTTSRGPPADRRADPAPRYPPTSPRSPSARKGSPRSAGRRPGTAWSACARPRGW